MDFYRLNDETGQLEVASQEVRLLKNEDGKSYWLKGLEYDILVMYDKPRGGLSVSPQLLEKVQGGYVYLAMWDVMNDYVLRNKSIGLISYATTNGIYLVDNGVWMGKFPDSSSECTTRRRRTQLSSDTRMQLRQSDW